MENNNASNMPSRRYQLGLLHSLVTIVLCYQMVFSIEGPLSTGWKHLIVAGLLGVILLLFWLPEHLWSSKWLTSSLVLGDTLITCLVIYLAGQATSNLYMTFFLIILIAAFAPSLTQLVVLSLLLCAAYGLMLYFEDARHLLYSEGRLLQLPVLFILGIFYGVTNHTARSLRREKETLQIHLDERKRVEKVLRASEKRYRNWVRLSPDGIIIVRDDKIDFVNKAGCRILGADTDEHILHQSPYAFIGKADQEDIKRQVEEVQNGRTSVTFVEKKIRRLDGTEIEVELGATAISEGDKMVVQLAMRDISERKELQEQIHQSQKMEAIGLLAGGIAHDFNNMLTVINGHSEMLADYSDLTEEQRQCVEPIRLAGQRASSLTSQLLAFSRRQVLQPTVLDLNAAVRKVQTMLKPLMGENIELKLNLIDRQIRVKVDPIQLEQVIINLALNARDAMPECGILQVNTGVAEVDPAMVPKEFSGVQGGPYVVLKVTDSGVGMDPKTQAKIFEPFFTTRVKGKGTGLGLSTVFGIIKQSGGFITVTSRLHEGSTFALYLPAVEETIPQEVTEVQKRTGGGTETLLVVDDETGVRSMVRDFLQVRGYSVLVAMDGPDALEISAQYAGHIDMLVTDVIMPGMSGREMSERFLQQRPDTKVLFMSGYTDDDVFQKGVSTAHVNFIQKPFTLSVLEDKIRHVLEQEPSPLA